MRDIKFRAWMDQAYIMIYFDSFNKPDNVLQSDFIMQYTGLKDKNGVEIYESDLVKYQDGSQVSEVFYSDNEAQFKIKMFNGNEIGIHALSIFSKIFEVIGNIHENKELLNT